MAVAKCASVSALTLGLPEQTAMPEGKGKLPQQLFYAKVPVSSGLKRRFVNDISEIGVLGIVNSSNMGLPAEGQLKEILVIGVVLNTSEVPVDALEHMAKLRPSGILFVCIRSGNQGDECALAVRRAVPVRAGHMQQNTMFVGQWYKAQDLSLKIRGKSIDEVWESFNSQTILNTPDPENLDERIARSQSLSQLRNLEAKLAKDHARAKNPTQRNEIYAKLHKVRAQLESFNEGL
ncbi:DUF4391 domain-containing protein [Bifidobacterium aquikefiricola]|uniref:DUF4391 domain-containing protein n=1 Tax=Bifidobacterium aquikefiricola TaxID=3059038 RepID=A0AB39U5N2_9BIFI